MGRLEQFDIILEISERSPNSPQAVSPNLERPLPVFSRQLTWDKSVRPRDMTSPKSVFLSRSDVGLIGASITRARC